MQRLAARPLTGDAFAPFGEMVTFDPGCAQVVNGGRALRSDAGARLDAEWSGATPVLAIYRAQGEVLPFPVAVLERHPHSSQAFVALSAGRFLVVVAQCDTIGGPNLDRTCAFIGGAGQGINYRRGVWHSPIAAIGAEADFLMFMWERGTPDDCVVHRLSVPLHIVEPSP